MREHGGIGGQSEESNGFSRVINEYMLFEFVDGAQDILLGRAHVALDF